MRKLKKSKIRCIFSCILAASITAGVMTGTAVSAFAVETEQAAFSTQYDAERDAFSKEFMSTDFFIRLNEAKENSKSASTMERAVAVALSQEGYKNYSTEGIDIEQAKKDGLLWTGAVKRMNSDLTGNTEYTRWAERYIKNSNEAYQYSDYNWCAIFISWCMYQAGYYDEEQLKNYYYSYYADPRIEFDADAWIEAFNLEQENVWYTSIAGRKLEAYSWNHFVNTNVDPYDIPYKSGGLIFFSWDGSGQYFNHVGMVVDYDPETHVLTYTNGNSDGQVITRQMDLDNEEEFFTAPFLKNSGRIMAYGEYDKILPPEKKDITADCTQITWDKHAERGFTVQTDSVSKIAKVFLDGEYLGSNIESNMIFRYGTLSIGKSELVNISNGVHTLVLDFDDGSVEIELTVTNQKDLEPDNTVFLYNDKSDEQLVINTASESEKVYLYAGEKKIADSIEGSMSITDGKITVPSYIIGRLDTEKGNELKVVADDGEFTVTVYRTYDETGSTYNYVMENADPEYFSYGSLYADDENNFSSLIMRSPEAGDYRILVFGKNENNASVLCTETALTFEDESINIQLNFDAENNTVLLNKIEVTVFEADKTDFEWDAESTEGISINITPAPEKAALLTTDGVIMADETNGLVIDGNTVVIGTGVLGQLNVNDTVPLNLIVCKGIDYSTIAINITVTKTEPKEESEESSKPESSAPESSDTESSDTESSDTESSDAESSDTESSETESSEQSKASPLPQPGHKDYPSTGSSAPISFIISALVSAFAAIVFSAKKKNKC